jgi:hypothetical protein
MSTSQKLSLYKPVDGEPIPLTTLAYFRARLRRKLHSVILKEFKSSGISQAELTRRLRKDAATISRMISTPGNWSLDTVSDLLFAMRGAEPVYSLVYPLEKPARNFGAKERLEFSVEPKINKETTSKPLVLGAFEREPA